MKGIDTNILVRFIVGDDEMQVKKVYNIFKSAETDNNEPFVSSLVIMELIWVLESVYKKERMHEKSHNNRNYRSGWSISFSIAAR